MEWVVIWVGLAVLAGVIAANKGRSGIGFFFLSVILSPLIGIIAAAVVAPNQAGKDRQALASGQSRKCPFCGELIRPEAIVCRFCGRDLNQPSLSTPMVSRSGMTIQPLVGDKPCVSCGKVISGEAVRCKFCGGVQPAE